MPEVVEVGVAETYDLRRRILREGTPSDEFRFSEDAWPGTFHLAVRGAESAPEAVATFCERLSPHRPGQRAIQLRGMAVDHDRQGMGLGRHLLLAGMERARAVGATVLWANARDTAVPFYVRLGMQVEGEGFLTHDTRLPHHVVVIDL